MPLISSRLARQIKRVESDESPWVPRVSVPKLHLGFIDDVDYYNNTAVFQTNDPSLKTLPTCRWVEMYSPLNPPAPGDFVQAMHYGTSVRLMGRIVVPESVVILG